MSNFYQAMFRYPAEEGQLRTIRARETLSTYRSATRPAPATGDSRSSSKSAGETSSAADPFGFRSADDDVTQRLVLGSIGPRQWTGASNLMLGSRPNE